MRGTATVRTAVSFLLGGFLLACPAGRLNISRSLWAQQGPKVQTFSGKIVSQNDVRLVLRDDDNAVWYHLDDQQKAAQFFGKDVLITGTFDGLSGTIRVQSIVEGEPPAKPPANTEDMKQDSEPAKGGTAAPAGTDTVAPSVRQAHPAQAPSDNMPTARADSEVRSESEAMHHPQGEVSTSPVREAAPTFLLTLPEEAVSASSSVAISSRRLVPMPPGVNRQMQPARNLVVGRLLRRVDPAYPPDALQQRIDGTVRLRAAIGEDGKVQSVEPLSGPPLLVGAAVIAVHEWRYGPTIFDGRHIQTQTDISLVFRLPY
ncbi:MAG: energy transducer TonB [Candidatus Acidiferrales bacterium]